MNLSIIVIKLYNYKNEYLKYNYKIIQELTFLILPYTFYNDIDIKKKISEYLYSVCKLFSKDKDKFYLLYSVKSFRNNNESTLTSLNKFKNNMVIENIDNQGSLVVLSLFNLFKMDHIHKDSDLKKLVRKSLIICLQYPEIVNTQFFKSSFFPELLIERFIVYFELIPYSFEVSNKSNINNSNNNKNMSIPSIDIAYNLKETFPIMLNEFLEFRDFLNFFNKIYNCIISKNVKNEIKILFFNWFLIDIIQNRLISYNLKEFRTTLQYLLFIINSFSNNIELCFIIYVFVFGFPDSSCSFKLKKLRYEDLNFIKNCFSSNKNRSIKIIKHCNTDRILCNNEDTLDKDYINKNNNDTILENNYNSNSITNSNNVLNSYNNDIKTTSKDNNNNQSIIKYLDKLIINKSNNKDTKYESNKSNKELSNTKYKFRNSINKNLNINTINNENNIHEEYNPYSYNYNKHNYIGLSYAIMSNLNNSKECIDIVCLYFFEIIIEKLPFLAIRRFIQPFCDSIINKQNIKTNNLNNNYPQDLSSLNRFIELIENKKINSSMLSEYLNYNISKTINIYLKNHIDFNSYYQSIREDKEQLNFIDRKIRESLVIRNSNSKNNSSKRLKRSRKSLANLNTKDNFNNNVKDILDETLKNNNTNLSLFNPRATYNKGCVLAEYIITHKKSVIKDLNKNMSYVNKIYDDEAEGVEEEMNNIYILLLKAILELFTSFFYNSYNKNLFITVS